jgi:hypothetical protein
MIPAAPIHSELAELLEASCFGELSSDQEQRLCDLVCHDAENRAHYVLFMHMNAMIERRAGHATEENSTVSCDEASEQDVSASPQTYSFLLPSHQNNVSFIASGWPIAYLAATVILSIGIALAAVTEVSKPALIATHRGSGSLDTFSSLPNSPQNSEVVGKITGIVDCVYDVTGNRGHGAGKSGQDVINATISLGDRFSLRSGLLEITYNTGARVILQGPVTYKVDSADGGFLAVGKLTARLEKKPASAAAQARVLLFSVRTPTAIVTDLGTEFGVEVNEAGVTRTHVFAGKVKVASLDATSSDKAAEQLLTAGQSAIAIPDLSVKTISWEASSRFVRLMPKPEQSVARLIGQEDYSETWTANSPTRSGSYLMLTDPAALRVEQCHGNTPRSWVFSREAAMTTWPLDNPPVPWPGCVVPGTKSGFLELGTVFEGYLGFEYGLRDDFVVQFDAVQTDDRINITIGDQPATIFGENCLSIFFRAPGTLYPEIGVFTPSRGEIGVGLHSGIQQAWQWHNYAVRFNLRKQAITVWVDRQERGTIDLATLQGDAKPNANPKDSPWVNRFVTIGGFSPQTLRFWSDNFRIGSPYPSNHLPGQESRAVSSVTTTKEDPKK